MDKLNRWIVPGLSLLAFAVLWTLKLSKVALPDATCKGLFGKHDLSGTPVDDDAQQYCATAERYFVGPNEPFLRTQKLRDQRRVQDPELALWFWALIFVMCLIIRLFWTLFVGKGQGVNVNNVLNAAKSVAQTDSKGVMEVDEEKLGDCVPVISDNFQCAEASPIIAAFLTFELALAIGPLFLLIVVLPQMIGPHYRTWGFDVALAWWKHGEWQGISLQPLFDGDGVHVPLMPRVSYCDYHLRTWFGKVPALTYRCTIDANWHERSALCTWTMLAFMAFVNACNLFFWIVWAWNMRSRRRRQEFVLANWLNVEKLPLSDRRGAEAFAATFRMSHLLLFHFIEAHTNRVVASAFCMALFKGWRRHSCSGYVAILIENAEPAARGLY